MGEYEPDCGKMTIFVVSLYGVVPWPVGYLGRFLYARASHTPMTVVTSPGRVLKVAGSLMLLWLLPAVVADAAPTLRRSVAGPLCDAQPLTPKKLRRLPRSFGGPLKAAKRRAVTVSTDRTARLGHARRVHLPGDGAIIPNDAPPARVDSFDRLVPSLRSLGVFSGAIDIRPLSRTFSPRSPRGPPFVA
jgi:hypothetical protein